MEPAADFKMHLLMALEYYGIPVVQDEGKRLELPRGYHVEVENHGVFKLMSEGRVIAPFDDLDELCQFILLG